MIFQKNDDDFEIKVFEIYSTWEHAEVGHVKWIETASKMTFEDFDTHEDLIKNVYSFAVDLLLNIINLSQDENN